MKYPAIALVTALAFCSAGEKPRYPIESITEDDTVISGTAQDTPEARRARRLCGLIETRAMPRCSMKYTDAEDSRAGHSVWLDVKFNGLHYKVGCDNRNRELKGWQMPDGYAENPGRDTLHISLRPAGEKSDSGHTWTGVSDVGLLGRPSDGDIGKDAEIGREPGDPEGPVVYVSGREGQQHGERFGQLHNQAVDGLLRFFEAGKCPE